MKKPPEFGPTKRLRDAYAAGIAKITGRVLKPKLPEQTLDEWLQELAERSRDKDIRAAAEVLAKQMISQVNVGNQRTWRAAAAKSMQSRRLYRLLQKEMQGATGRAVDRLVQANAKYISSVSLEAATKLVDEVKRAQLAGARPKTIAKMMKARFPALLKSRTQLIARTEVAKTSSALTQARSEELGLDWYEWNTSEDARVRDSHKKMDGVLCSWREPPDPEALTGEKSAGHYSVGQIYNCRCTSTVLLNVDDVSWPHRVYHGGAIKQMTRIEFLRIAGIDVQLTA